MNKASEVSPKVKAVAAAGATVTAVTLVAALLGVEVKVDEEGVAGLAALLTLIQVAAGYIKRDPLREG